MSDTIYYFIHVFDERIEHIFITATDCIKAGICKHDEEER